MLNSPLCPGARGAVVSIDWSITSKRKCSQMKTTHFPNERLWDNAMTSCENADVLLSESPKKLPVSFSGPINLIHLVLHQLISIFVVIFHKLLSRIMSKVICQTREIVCYQSPRHWEESRKDVAQRCIFEEVFWSGVVETLSREFDIIN